MSLLTVSISLVVSFVLTNLACGLGGIATSADVAAFDPAAAAVNQVAPQPAGFITVEGADLNSRMEAAIRRARSASPQTPFWTAYAFDVRPGVAVDPNVREFHGSMNSSGGTNVFVGTSNGMTVETRNLGIFLLRDAAAPSGNTITRLEVYNLERRREYSRYPVYWLGRAGNEESLNLLRGLAESSPQQQQSPRAFLIAEHAALALALHDDARVGDMLRNLVRASAHQKVRANAVYWLGQVGGQQSFLMDLVRNEGESAELRAQAAHAIGESRDQTALASLQSLYETIADRRVKHSIIHAVGNNENRDGAASFLLRVAKADPDREARRKAIHQLGDTDRETVVDELMKIYAAAAADSSIQGAVLHALSEMENARARAKLLEIARTAAAADVRAQAIHRLGERGDDATVDELMKIYNSDSSTRVREQILHAFSEMKITRAEDRLFEIARRSDSRELRARAIHWIGERAGERSLELLRDTVSSPDADTEVQVQAVRAISERPAEEAVPLLIKIARTHPNQQVRHYAIKQLGESGDPRAVEFFKELLGK